MGAHPYHTVKRLSQVDALRGLAALAVILFHFTTRFTDLYRPELQLSVAFPYGHFGVNLFFIVSGFVIFMTLENTTYPMDFVVSRFSRLFPSYWSAIILTFLVTHLLGLPGKLVDLWPALANFFMMHSIFGVPHVDGVYWTLEVEMLFYIGMFLLFRLRWLNHIHWVLLAGVLTAPIPAALKGEPDMVQRALYMIPFVALIAAMGFAQMWQARHRMIRVAAMLLLLAVPIQFAEFYFDYFTHYKFRSAFYYDPVAFRDVAQYLFDQGPAPAYYFADDLDDASAKWRFYAIKHSREELLPRTQHVAADGAEAAAAPAGSFLVMYVDRAKLAALEQPGQWAVVKVIKDVDQREAAAILRKVG